MMMMMLCIDDDGDVHHHNYHHRQHHFYHYHHHRHHYYYHYYRAGEFIVQVLQSLHHWVGGAEEVAALYKESALDLKSFIIPPPREVSRDEMM